MECCPSQVCVVQPECVLFSLYYMCVVCVVQPVLECVLFSLCYSVYCTASIVACGVCCTASIRMCVVQPLLYVLYSQY